MLEATGQRRLFMDADNSTDLGELLRLDAAHPDARIRIASIAAPGAEIVHRQPGLRTVLGRIGNLVVRLLVLPGVRDSQRGFKIFTADAATEIFSRSRIDGWGFDIEVLGLARVLGYEMVEVGVRWEHKDDSRVQASAYVSTLMEALRIQTYLKQVSREVTRH